MKLLTRFIALAIAALPQLANAEAPNGAAILRSCSSEDDNSCVAYLNFIISGVVAEQSPICFPADETTNRIKEAIIGFLAAHPDFWTVDGDSAVAMALQLTYPCRSPDQGDVRTRSTSPTVSYGSDFRQTADEAA